MDRAMNTVATLTRILLASLRVLSMLTLASILVARMKEFMGMGPRPRLTDDELPRSKKKEDDLPRSKKKEDDLPRSKKEEDDLPRSKKKEDDLPRSKKKEDDSPEPYRSLDKDARKQLEEEVKKEVEKEVEKAINAFEAGCAAFEAGCAAFEVKSSSVLDVTDEEQLLRALVAALPPPSEKKKRKGISKKPRGKSGRQVQRNRRKHPERPDPQNATIERTDTTVSMTQVESEKPKKPPGKSPQS